MSLTDWTPRSKPGRMTIDRRYVHLEPLDPAGHGDEFFEAGGPNREALWRDLADHPFSNRASYEPWLAPAAASGGSLFFAVLDQETGRAEGRLTRSRSGANDTNITPGPDQDQR